MQKSSLAYSHGILHSERDEAAEGGRQSGLVAEKLFLTYSLVCSPGWPATQRDPLLLPPSASLKGVRHHTGSLTFFHSQN